jgi:RNA polymerase sigma factor (sigma-70 family)
MATARLGRFIKDLRRTSAAPDGADRQLLARFVEERDEVAFAELVARHGSLVFGVCERLLGHRQDAEDAFQATFLLLARKASSVRWTNTAGPWLYEVARRIALEARTTRDRRRARERPMSSEVPPPEVPPVEPQDWRPLFDDELGRLPEKYRTALVLCELEGRSRKDTARLLGVPEGTLSSRLAAARRMLAERLARRGVTLSGIVLAGTAAVPAALVESTVQIVMLVSAGVEAAVAGPAVALMKGTLTTMFIQKLKLAVAVVLVLGALGASGFVYVEKPARAQTETQAQAAKPPTDLDVMRKELELLRLKVQLLEAEVRALKGRTKAPQDTKAAPEMGRHPGNHLPGRPNGAPETRRHPRNHPEKGAGALDHLPGRPEGAPHLDDQPDRPKGPMPDRLTRPERPKLDPKTGRPMRVGQPSGPKARARDKQAELTKAVEDALKWLKEADDEKSRHDATEALERATQKLKEQMRKSSGRTDKRPD